ncbi:MAG: bifunctional folylpolyglutamate synthase/dihydrofolate synthase [Thermodesulfobacteriota bacterium]
MDRYQAALARLYELQKFGIKLGLSSTENLLARLGDPHLGLRCVHLAGTNGKGSVGAMLEASLLAAGVKAGFYTSPHLVRFEERFRLAGREITPDEALELIEAVWLAVDEREPPTFFEFVTAMAFLWFARQGAELAIIETGLGGRLDATNLVRPLATVITNIGLEHQQYLGGSHAAIAMEKAGIIKPGTPLAHGVTQPSARRVVEGRAEELGAPLRRLGRELRVRRRADGRFDLAGRLWRLPEAGACLFGRHQPGNAALALGALEDLAQAGVAVGPEHLRAGLLAARWPGRLQKAPQRPGRPALWLDGAHNLPAAKALLASLPDMRAGRAPLVMVVGVMADKDIGGILAALLPAADRVVFSRPVYERAADPAVLAAQAPPKTPPSTLEPDLGRAMALAEEMAGPEGVVLVTGSLFTVGEALERLGLA